MMYSPHYKSMEYLLRQAGFTPSDIGIGWERVLTYNEKGRKRKNRRDRLHAHVHHGYIDIHFDKEVRESNKKMTHRAFRGRMAGNGMIGKVYEEIQFYDSDD